MAKLPKPLLKQRAAKLAKAAGSPPGGVAPGAPGSPTSSPPATLPANVNDYAIITVIRLGLKQRVGAKYSVPKEYQLVINPDAMLSRMESNGEDISDLYVGAMTYFASPDEIKEEYEAVRETLRSQRNTWKIEDFKIMYYDIGNDEFLGVSGIARQRKSKGQRRLVGDTPGETLASLGVPLLENMGVI